LSRSQFIRTKPFQPIIFPSIIDNIKTIYKYRELLVVWTFREVRVRYKQSILGGLWAILQPLALMFVFTLVFSFMARLPTDGFPYPIFSYSSLLPWTFFATSLSFGIPSLINNINLVTRTYFPREILPISAIASSFIDYLIASSVFILLIIYYRIPLSWTFFWLPIILFIQIILMIGITLLGSAIIVFYRDVRFIIPLGLQLWLFITPVIYPVSMVPERFLPLYMLNPMAGIIESFRLVILYGQNPVWLHLGISTVISTGVFVFGFTVFKKLEVYFADLI
jgi:lipopolysaccharide transport system permease protein